METYRCRPCLKDFAETGLTNVRRCPQCGGPLLSHAQLLAHERSARESLDRMRRQSACTMVASALLMMAMQAILSAMQSAEVAAFFNWLVPAVASGAILAAGRWLFSAQKFWMLAGAVLLQTAAALFFFVVMGVGHEMELPGRWNVVIASLPMAGALLAWHQFRSYCQLLKLEQTKGRGCRVNSPK